MPAFLRFYVNVINSLVSGGPRKNVYTNIIILNGNFIKRSYFVNDMHTLNLIFCFRRTGGQSRKDWTLSQNYDSVRRSGVASWSTWRADSQSPGLLESWPPHFEPSPAASLDSAPRLQSPSSPGLFHHCPGGSAPPRSPPRWRLPSRSRDLCDRLDQLLSSRFFLVREASIHEVPRSADNMNYLELV